MNKAGFDSHSEYSKSRRALHEIAARLLKLTLHRLSVVATKHTWITYSKLPNIDATS